VVFGDHPEARGTFQRIEVPVGSKKVCANTRPASPEEMLRTSEQIIPAISSISHEKDRLSGLDSR